MKLLVFTRDYHEGRTLAIRLQAKHMHGRLSHAEKASLIQNFNDPSGFDTLVTDIHTGSKGWRAPKDVVILFDDESIMHIDSNDIYQAIGRRAQF